MTKKKKIIISLALLRLKWYRNGCHIMVSHTEDLHKGWRIEFYDERLIKALCNWFFVLCTIQEEVFQLTS